MRHSAIGLLLGVLFAGGVWSCGQAVPGSERGGDVRAAEGWEPHGPARAGHDDGDEHSPHGTPGEHPAGDDGEHDVVIMDAATQALAGVRIGTAVAGGLAAQLDVPAELDFAATGVTHVGTVVDGQLVAVDVAVGDAVRAGDRVALMRSVDVGQARAELSRARARAAAADQHRDRQRALRYEGINAERDLIDAELASDEARAELEAATVRLRAFGAPAGASAELVLQSPGDGVVVERRGVVGQSVEAGTTLAVIADLSRVLAIGAVAERDVASVTLGMAATLTLRAYPGRSWSGTVDVIGSEVDRASRTLPVRIELDNPDGVLRPGLSGTLTLLPASRDATGAVVPPDATGAVVPPDITGAAVPPDVTSAIVPAAAVQEVEGRSVVFVPGDEPGELVAREVVLGASAGGRVEVLSGLSAGDALVVEGAFVVRSELVRGELGHGHAH
ncbi:MAG: efflux RND transporter periplasmic adaptor subunit [Myxococcales bacterium]|nr:efflux RND transporter periplasmic adaptor subunit [Myxococcales bacterium]MCB9530794.1 efflux RND transporter periplasmic adaptor subunit [Myxococcales bacterium]